jgi:protein tyrosine/serine phosphatase
MLPSGLAMNQRVLPLEGIHNFRDYGGYASSHGGRVKPRVLWRSAQHVEASDADLAALDDLGLAAVIDLRGESERAASPCRRSPGFAGRVFTHPGETAGLAPHMEAAAEALDVQSAHGALLGYYHEMPHRENLVPALRNYFAAMADEDEPSLVHCVAGKDRTGFAVAMMHHILGVHPDDAMADYLLTNQAGRIDERIAKGAEHIRSRYGAIDDATMRVLMGVDAAFLAASLDAIAERHGTADAYLEAVLEVDAAMQDRLRAHYLAG